MSRSRSRENAAYRPSVPLPKRPERPEELNWPSPTPAPVATGEDLGKTLKLMLDRLDAIEKRLDTIEKMLMARQSV